VQVVGLSTSVTDIPVHPLEAVMEFSVIELLDHATPPSTIVPAVRSLPNASVGVAVVLA